MKKREAMRNLRKSLHKIRLKSTLWAKDKWKTIMIFNLLTDIVPRTFIPFGSEQKINKRKNKLPVH